jgi:AcrR family transcriptional regulator
VPTPPAVYTLPIAAPAPARRADAARNREALIHAARATYREDGLQVGVDRIARRAGVGTATLYRHFPTKDHLVEAILEERFVELEAVAAEALAATDPGDAVTTLIRRVAAIQREDRGFTDAIAQRLIGEQTALRLRARFVALIEPVVSRAREARALHPDIDALDVAITCRMLGAVREDDDTERYLAVVLRGIAGA